MGLKAPKARVWSLLYTETEGEGQTSQLNIGKMIISRCATVTCGLSLRNILTPSIQPVYGAVIGNRFIPHWVGVLELYGAHGAPSFNRSVPTLLTNHQPVFDPSRKRFGPRLSVARAIHMWLCCPTTDKYWHLSYSCISRPLLFLLPFHFFHMEYLCTC